MKVHALPEIQPIDKQQPLPLSLLRSAYGLLTNILGGKSHFYNMPVALRLVGKLDADALECSFQSLVSRHMSLRTVFVNDNGTPKQVIQGELLFDLAPQVIGEDELQLTINGLASEAFDLANGPLFIVKLFQLGKQEHILFVNMHHIVSDGVSL